MLSAADNSRRRQRQRSTLSRMPCDAQQTCNKHRRQITRSQYVHTGQHTFFPKGLRHRLMYAVPSCLRIPSPSQSPLMCACVCCLWLGSVIGAAAAMYMWVCEHVRVCVVITSTWASPCEQANPSLFRSARVHSFCVF